MTVREHTLYLSDIIAKTGLSFGDYVVVRHSLGETPCRLAWEKGKEYFEEYQRIQLDANYFKGKKYVFAFISGISTTARLVGCYELCGIQDIKNIIPKAGYPISSAYDKGVYIDLQKNQMLEDLCDRLVIDWGTSTNQIVQYSKEAIENKPVIGITPKYDFVGYDKVIYRFPELEEVISNPVEYLTLHNALKAVNGVYVMQDTITGKLYIGSAYGEDGILGRWKTYVKTKGLGGKEEAGANVKIEKLLKDNPDRYKDFQYSILETIKMTGNKEKDKHAALELEAIYKKKLGSIEYGLNAN